MIRLQETIEVARPIDEAFFYASDFSNIAQWDPGVAESRKTTPGTEGSPEERKQLCDGLTALAGCDESTGRRRGPATRSPSRP